MCTLFFRCWLARINGRINSIAPVVPIQLARAVPMKIIIVFNIGVPTREPFNCTPPDIVKDNNKMINGTYSNKAT